MIGQRSPVAEVLQRIEVTEAIYYRWRDQFGAVSPDEANGSRSSRWRTPG